MRVYLADKIGDGGRGYWEDNPTPKQQLSFLRDNLKGWVKEDAFTEDNLSNLWDYYKDITK